MEKILGGVYFAIISNIKQVNNNNVIVIWYNAKTEKQEKLLSAAVATLNADILVIDHQLSLMQTHSQSYFTLTDGIVKVILTKSPNHPHGIKVRLESGDVGRVKVIKA